MKKILALVLGLLLAAGPAAAVDTFVAQSERPLSSQTVGDLTLVPGNIVFTGETAPGAPTAALVTDGTGLVTAGATDFKITFVTATGETTPSVASNSVTADGTHTKITVARGTGTPSAAVLYWNIYKKEVATGLYKYAQQVAIGTTSVTFNLADASLTTAEPTVNTTAGKLTGGVSFDGTAAKATLWGAYAGITGPSTARTYTFPDAAATMLYSGGALGTPASGTLTNCTGLPVAGVTGALGYVIPFTTGQVGSPVDATDYYFGSHAGTAPGSTYYQWHKIPIQTAGTITRIDFGNYETAGTGETSTLYISVNGGGAWTALTSGIVNNAGAGGLYGTRYNITGLSIAVTAGQVISFKWTTPSWVTNPSNVWFSGCIYIQ